MNLVIFYKHEEFVIKPVGMATSIWVRKVSRSNYEKDISVASIQFQLK